MPKVYAPSVNIIPVGIGLHTPVIPPCADTGTLDGFAGVISRYIPVQGEISMRPIVVRRVGVQAPGFQRHIELPLLSWLKRYWNRIPPTEPCYFVLKFI